MILKNKAEKGHTEKERWLIETRKHINRFFTLRKPVDIPPSVTQQKTKTFFIENSIQKFSTHLSPLEN